MRAAIYVRVSTDREEQKLSPEHQMATCREYASEHGMVTADEWVYSDTGLTGTEMEHRPEVQRLLADARQGRFDVVLFTAISRVARDLADALALKKKLETVYGVRIVSIEEGYDSAIEGRNSEMVFTVYAMLAAQKSQEMSRAIRRGLRQSARRGRHIGNMAPFGYRKGPDHRLLPNEEEAAIVREIYRMYLNGMSSQAIADALNRRGVPTAQSRRTERDTRWRVSTVIAILHNPVYIGTVVANRWRRDIDIERSRRLDRKVKRQMLRPEQEWVVVPQAHEPLVDHKTWTMVQTLMAAKARNRGIRRTGHALSGLMRCAECGGAGTVTQSKRRHVVYKYIVCASRRRNGKHACMNRATVRYDHLLSAVLRPLDHCLGGLKRVLCTDMDSGSTRVSLVQTEVERRMSELVRQIRRNRRAQRENLRAFTLGLFDEDVIVERQRELTAESERLRAELAEWSSKRRQLEPRQSEGGVQDACAQDSWWGLDTVTMRAVLDTFIHHIEFGSDRRVRVIYRCGPHPFLSDAAGHLPCP